MKYIDAEKLLAEIEGHIKEVKEAENRFHPNLGFFDAKLSGIYDVLSIIDSLPDEGPSKELEEAAKEFATQTMPFTDETYVDEGAYHGFIAGAEWQKEQDAARRK